MLCINYGKTLICLTYSGMEAFFRKLCSDQVPSTVHSALQKLIENRLSGFPLVHDLLIGESDHVVALSNRRQITPTIIGVGVFPRVVGSAIAFDDQKRAYKEVNAADSGYHGLSGYWDTPRPKV